MAKTRSDAKVGTLEKKIEKRENLPPGAVKIINKDGRDTRSDKRVEKIRKDK